MEPFGKAAVFKIVQNRLGGFGIDPGSEAVMVIAVFILPVIRAVSGMADFVEQPVEGFRIEIIRVIGGIRVRRLATRSA